MKAFLLTAAFLAICESPLVYAAVPLLLFSDTDNATNVIEYANPAELVKALQVADNTQDCDHAQLLLLYSAWCPHCHAFAPVWNELASRLSDCCPGIKVSAFECLQNSESRVLNATEWEGLTALTLPTGIKKMGPREACGPLVSGFPTMIALTPSHCQLDEVEGFKAIESERISHFGIQPAEFKWKMWKVEHPPTLAGASDFILRNLRSGKLAPKCGPEDSEGEPDYQAAVEELLKGPLNHWDTYNLARWSSDAVDLDPDARLHDAVYGFWHIFNGWVVGSANSKNLTTAEMGAVRRLLILTAAAFPPLHDKGRIIDAVREVNDMMKGSKLPVESWKEISSLTQWLAGLKRPDNLNKIIEQSRDCETTSCMVWTFFHEALALSEARESMPNSEAADDQVECLTQELIDSIPEEKLQEWGVELQLEAKPQPDLCITGSAILATFHDIIYHFFDCAECRQHFHDAYAACTADRCTWATSSAPYALAGRLSNATESTASMLWLWRFHNIVNVRTAFEKAYLSVRRMISQPHAEGRLPAKHFEFQNVDVRWPSVAQCPQCRNGAPAFSLTAERLLGYIADTNSTEFDFIDDFDLDVVAAFLRRHFVRNEWLHRATLQWEGACFLLGSSAVPRQTTAANGELIAGYPDIKLQHLYMAMFLPVALIAASTSRWVVRHKLWRWLTYRSPARDFAV